MIKMNLIIKKRFLSKSRQGFCLLISLFGLVSFSASSPAEIHKIFIIQSEKSDFYQNLTAKLKSRLNDLCQPGSGCANNPYNFHITSVEELKEQAIATDSYSQVITLGVKAENIYHQLALPHSQQQVIHALVPFDLALKNTSYNHISLVLDQPLERQLQIINQLVPSTKPIGIIYSDNSLWIEDAAANLSPDLNIPLITVKANTDQFNDFAEILQKTLPHVRLILMIPDKSLYNRLTIKQTLLTGYFSKVPFW